jgi:cytidylate kinase
MDHYSSPDQWAQTLEHLGRHWEEKRRAAARQREGVSAGPEAFTIALSREAGTQGTAIAHEVGRRLGWPVYDSELLEMIAQDMGVRTNLLASVDERRLSWVGESFETLMSIPYASEFAFIHRLVKTVLALGSHGECVIVGRGSAFILPAKSTLRVRLIAPMGFRIATIARQYGVDREAATRQLGILDRDRNAFVRDHFFKDPADPHAYDLIINVARCGIAGCAGHIIDALDRLRARNQGGDTAGGRHHEPEHAIVDAS